MSTNASTNTLASGAGGCFPAIADRAEEAIAVVDADGVVHYANGAWVVMHGYAKRSDVIGKRISAFHNDEQIRGDILPFLREVAQKGRVTGPVGHIHTGGREIPTITTMVALKDQAGELKAVVVYATDVSELNQLKEVVRQLQRDLEMRTLELKSAIQRLDERAKEVEMVENLLRARGDELSAANRQLWQYVSASAQAQEQLTLAMAELADKKKAQADLENRLQRQTAEQARAEQHWKKQYQELCVAIQQLHHEVIDMKHREVEFLEDVDRDAQPVGAGMGLDLNKLKEISDMAKKFAGQ